jgi:uncharacterized protein YjbI with pentapeptide repeats
MPLPGDSPDTPDTPDTPNTDLSSQELPPLPVAENSQTAGTNKGSSSSATSAPPSFLKKLRAAFDFWKKCQVVHEHLPGIPERVKQHQLWIANKQFGEKDQKLDLTNADLRHCRDLKGADLRGATLTDTCLWDTDLTGTDLREVEGLLPGALSGAVLTRAKLPDDIAKFDGLKTVEELSKNAGKLFLSLMLAMIFVLLTISMIKDPQLILDTGTATLPVVSISVPVRLFFFIAPVVLLVLFVSTHLYLQRLWEQMAALPAVFPDGVTLDKKTYPWLLNDRIRAFFPNLRNRRGPLAYTQEVLFGFLAYWMVPLALFPLWTRYLCCHDPLVTGAHVIVLTAMVWFSAQFWFLGRLTMARSPVLFPEKEGWYGDFKRIELQAVTAVTGVLVVVHLGLLWAVSQAAHTGMPSVYDTPTDPRAIAWKITHVRQEQYRAQGVLQKWVPLILEGFGLSNFAHLKSEELSKKPPNWQMPKQPKRPPLQTAADLKGKDEKQTAADDKARKKFPEQWEEYIAKMKQVQRAPLRGKDLRFAEASSAFLVYGDLAGAQLQQANLVEAILIDAHLTGANLWQANLHEADLSDVYAQGADFTQADLGDANLQEGYLKDANLTDTDLSGANLTNAILDGVHYTIEPKWPKGYPDSRYRRAERRIKDPSGKEVREYYLIRVENKSGKKP